MPFQDSVGLVCFLLDSQDGVRGENEEYGLKESKSGGGEGVCGQSSESLAHVVLGEGRR